MFFRRKSFEWRNFVSGLREIVYQETRRGIGLSPRQRLRAWRYGFLSSSWVLYGFGDKPHRDYLPDFPHYLLARRTNKDQQVFDNKVLFPAVFGALLEIPDNLCLLHLGRVLPLPAGRGRIVDLESLLRHCRESGGVVCKPLDGMGGQDVSLLTFDGSTGFQLNGRPASEQQVQALIEAAKNSLVCDAVTQSAYAASIFPGSANTVRLNVMVDPRSGRAFLSSAVHRFGTRQSAPVDNWAAGGLVAIIDLATGTLGAATTKPVGGRVDWVDHHPDTGARIKGVVIPGWDAIVARLLEVTEAYHGISRCGWDVVVREDGFSVLEGNNHPTLTMLQLAGGLLRDERTRRFYVHHEVIRS